MTAGAGAAKMLAFVGRVAEGLLIIFMLMAGALFHVTTTEIRRRGKDETARAMRLRLWAAYRAKWRSTLSSAMFWGVAGLITALVIFLNW
jgi:hypothetical protein